MKRFKYLTLAALVAFAACDEGTETVVEPPVTGSISGVVTIEGVAAAGVTVTLSSGQSATTDASGAFTFSGVPAGAYTVSISGFANDATFSSTSKAATIASAGQVVSVNFDGSYVRTSAILGSVAAGGQGLAGITVSIGSSSTQTDANGQYSFSGLRAGTYTVSMSGFDATLYSFASTTQDVTVGVGESKVVSFSGSLLNTATVSGRLFIDENDKNDQFDGEALEDNLSVANVGITIEGGLVGVTMSTQTAADGTYSFTDLSAGTYRVTIDATDSDIPGAVTFGGTASVLVSVSTGANGVVNFPFDIVTQYVKSHAFLGTDADVATSPGPGITPLSGVTIDLYDTQANAAAGGATGRLGQATTGADGSVTFSFTRANDDSPGGGPDNIVFARFNSVSSGNKSVNGETIHEIKYNLKDSLVMAPDTFDLLNSQIILRFDAKDGMDNTLSGWNAALWRNSTTAASIQAGTTNSSGIARFVESTGPAALPDTFYVRLSATQAGANGHGFSQAPEAQDGAASGEFLMIVHDGTQPDSVFLGTERITYTDADIQVRAHHEMDDSTDIATFSAGDALAGSTNLDVQLYSVDSNGAATSVAGPFALAPATGDITFGVNGVGGAIATGKTYQVRARSRVANQDVLNDTLITIDLDGKMQADTLDALKGSQGYSSFAWKYNDGGLTGTVRAADGTDADGLTVTIMPTSDNIQSNITDTTLTISGGAYSIGGLREGPYTVTAAEGDSATVWELVTFAGSNNTDARNGTRDLQGATDSDIVNFRAVRLDTKIQGVVINDRDSDFTVIDPDEALSGASLELYRDGSGAIGFDTLVATATTDANGAYSFEGLREGRYVVKWVAGTPSTDQDVFRSLTTDTAVATTAATTTGSGANNTRVVGTTTPGTLPRWNYATSQVDGGFLPTNFTFLFKNTKVTGTVTDQGTGAGIAAMTISLRRCDDSTGAASPPPAVGGGVICTTYLGTTQNTVTDSSGMFEFTGLIEGVYEVTPQPGTVGGYTSANPAQRLYLTVGNGDIENGTFTAN